MSDEQADSKKRWFRWWMIPLGLVALWLLNQVYMQIRYGDMPVVGWTPPFPPDCYWGGEAQAYVDENANGEWDNGEPPLETVPIYIDDTLNHFKKVSGGLTDWNGVTPIGVWLPGCPRAKFEVYPEVPEGLELLTEPRISASVKETGLTFSFGFRYLPDTPIPTPYVPQMNCLSYPGNAETIAIADDGTIWATTMKDALRFDPETKTWQEIIIPGDDVLDYENIQFGESTPVFLYGSGLLAWYDGVEWEVLDWPGYDIVPGFGVGPDGTVWFFSLGRIAGYNPENDSYKLYGTIGLDDNTDFFMILGSLENDWLAAIGRLDPEITPPAPPDSAIAFSELRLFQPDEIEIIAVEWITDVAIDSKGILWLTSTGTITGFDPSTGTQDQYSLADSGSPYVGAPGQIAIASDGSIWVTTGYEHNVLVHLTLDSQKNATWETYDARDGISDEAKMQSLEIGPGGEVWIGYNFGDVITKCTMNLE